MTDVFDCLEFSEGVDIVWAYTRLLHNHCPELSDVTQRSKVIYDGILIYCTTTDNTTSVLLMSKL